MAKTLQFERTGAKLKITPTRHYLALDGLRGVAALAVVYYHIANHMRLPWIPGRAYLAVDFFFMLSGFVVAHAYEPRLRQGMGVFRFMVVRLVRLYPCALAGIAIGTVTLLEFMRENHLSVMMVAQAWAANVLLLPTWAMSAWRPLAFPVDGPLWSLSLEIWFNLLYAACFRWLGNRTLWTLLLLGGALLAVLNWRAGGLNHGFACNDAQWGAVRFLFSFTAGLLLRRLASPHAARSRIGLWTFLPLLLLLICPAAPQDHISDAIIVMLAFPVLLTVASRAPASLWFDPVWHWLGEISFPIYVVHYPIVVAVSVLSLKLHLNSVLATLLSVFLLVVITLFAWLVLKLYDEPVRARLRRKTAMA